MTTSIRDFTAKLDAFDAAIRVAHADQLRDKAMDLMGRLVRGSPVKTGRFKGNWLASVSTPALAEMDTVDPGGQATIVRADAVLRDPKPFSSVYLTNNVPYAKRLEEGGSKQAPAGVVKVAVAESQSTSR